MNKTAIKNFAVWARNKLIADITYKAGLIGVSEKGIAQPLSQSSKDLQFFDIGTKDYAQAAGMLTRLTLSSYQLRTLMNTSEEDFETLGQSLLSATESRLFSFLQKMLGWV